MIIKHLLNYLVLWQTYGNWKAEYRKERNVTMGAVYLIFAVLFVLIAVAVAGGITLAKDRKNRKKYEEMAEEKLRIDRERLELEKEKAKKE